MRKLLIVGLFVFMLFAVSLPNLSAAESDHTVTITARFDSENTSTLSTLSNQVYGSRISFEESVGSIPNYTFAFWIVNGVVRYDLAVDHEFVVIGDMDIQAIFSQSGQNAVVYMDSNGAYLDIKYVLDNESAPNILVDSYHEDFSNLSISGSTYVDGSFIGNHDLVWHYVEVTGEQAYPIDGKGILLRRSDEPSSISTALSDGLSSFSFDVRKAFTGNTPREITVTISGAGFDPIIYEYDATVLAFGDGEDTTVIEISETGLDVTGDYTFKIEISGSTGNKHVVIDNITLNATINELATKPGYKLSSSMWDQSLDAITTDTVRTLQYDLDTSSMFTLDVVGEGQTEWAYNTLVTVTADAVEGQTFNYWLRDGEIVSYDETIKVSMLQDVTLEPVYSSQTVSEEPVIYLSDSIELRTGYTSHIAQFYLPEGYELIDYGMLTVDAPYIGFELDTVYLNDTVVNNQGLSYHAPSNEFLMTFTSANAVSVRAYMVYEYLGTIGVVYSYIPEAKTLDITSPFIGSPIVDVRVNDGFGGFVQEFTVYFDGVLYDTVTDGKTELASESLNANTIGRYVFVINGVEYPVEEE